MTIKNTGIVMGVLALLACMPAWPQSQAPACTQADELDCLYFPTARFKFTTYERSTSYHDTSDQPRQINMLLRVPIGAHSPMPVVVWSHGGAEGKASPANSMTEWSELTAAAGYFTISIAHAGRNQHSRRALCQSPALGIADDVTCKIFKYLNWDRPHDIRAVLDELVRMNTSGEFAGQIDLLRIAVGGHSAGAGGAQTIGGAKRIFTGAPQDLSDRRPVAFMALSPQQPGSEGFFDTRFQQPQHSWIDMHRPVFTATGDGDSTCNAGDSPGSCIGDLPYGRRIGFQRMPADGNKYQLYLHDADAFHTLFELNGSKCKALLSDPFKCAEMVRWLSSAGLAFLDGHVRQVPAAQQWLQSDRVEKASHGVAEWLRK